MLPLTAGNYYLLVIQVSVTVWRPLAAAGCPDMRARKLTTKSKVIVLLTTAMAGHGNLWLELDGQN